MGRMISLAVVLMCVWFVLSGSTEPLLLASGVVSVLLVVIIAQRMGMIDEEGVPIQLLCGLPVYLPWLAWQITLANLHVARTILSPSMKLEPGSAWIPASQQTPVGLVVFANSITLTPGTVSLSILEGRIQVHALSRKGLEDLRQGAMDRRVSAVEGRR